MKTRYDWAEQIGNEIFKNSCLYLADLIKTDTKHKEQNTIIVYNPLPWQRKDIVEFNTISQKTTSGKLPFPLKIIDSNEQEFEYQFILTKEEPRFSRKYGMSHKFTFIADVPACGYKVYYLVPSESEQSTNIENENFTINRSFLENKFYKITITSEGFINVIDKDTGITHENVCEFEDRGDWGDEYDFSGPFENQIDLVFTTEDSAVFERSVFLDGPTQKTFKLRLNLKLPYSLTEDRYNREEWLVDNKITIYISLYKNIKRIDFEIELENLMEVKKL